MVTLEPPLATAERRVSKRLLLLVPLSALVAASSLFAQGPSNDPWLAWAGCWQAVSSDAASLPVAGREHLLCMTPAARGGVVARSIAAGQESLETLFADGRTQSSLAPPTPTQVGCQGERQMEWSQNRRYLFTRGVLRCDGESERAVSGIILFVTASEWIDIHAFDSGDGRELTVVRYRRASYDRWPENVIEQVSIRRSEEARRLATAPWTVNDILEASPRVDPIVLEVAVVERGEQFELSARELLRLDEAAVPTSLIDLVVALSFPERFVVEASPYEAAATNRPAADIYPYHLVDPYASSTHFPDLFFFHGYYDPFGFYDADHTVCCPSVPVEPRPHGRVVKDRGYSRIADRRQQDDDSGGRSRGRGGSSSATSPSQGSSSSSAGSASPSGYSGGGGSGRTAQPRNR